MSVKVLIVDAANSDRGKANALAFQKNEAHTYFFDGLRRFHAPDWDIDVFLPSDFSLLVLHNNNAESWESLECHANLIIRYTGGGPPASGPGDEIWIRRRAITSKEDAMSEQEANQILHWAEAVLHGDIAAPLPTILRPPEVIKFLPAIAILCQAYLAVHAKDTNCRKDIIPALKLMGWIEFMESDRGGALIPYDLDERKSDVRQPKWWLKVFDLWDCQKKTVIQDKEKLESFNHAVKEEWRRQGKAATGEKMPDALNRLLGAMLNDNEVGPPKIVADAYHAIAEKNESVHTTIDKNITSR